MYDVSLVSMQDIREYEEFLIYRRDDVYDGKSIRRHER